MKKLILAFIFSFVYSNSFGAAGVGFTTWEAQTEAITSSDLFGITDVNDTTGSDDGTSKKVVFSQLDTYFDTSLSFGDVFGPSSVTDNAILRFDTTTGKLLQESGVTIDDSDLITVPSTVGAGILLPLEAESFTPTLAFGDGDTGFYESTDDKLHISVGGSMAVEFGVSHLVVGSNSGNPQLVKETPSSTNPVYVFWNDADTGIGHAAADQLSLIAGGVEAARFTEATGSITTSLTGDVDVIGELTAGTKTFLIDHPLDPTNKNLVHMAIEGPRVDLIYRGITKLIAGIATVNLDSDSTDYPMLPGTFDALTQNQIVVSLHNQDGFNRVMSSKISQGKFTITSEDLGSNESIAWVVMAERADPFIVEMSKTDNQGILIPEQDKELPDPNYLGDRVIYVSDEKEIGEEFEPAEVVGKKGYYRHTKAYKMDIPQRKIIKVKRITNVSSF